MGSLDARLGCGLHVGGVKGRLAGCRVHNPGGSRAQVRKQGKDTAEEEEEEAVRFCFCSITITKSPPHFRRAGFYFHHTQCTATTTTTQRGFQGEERKAGNRGRVSTAKKEARSKRL